MIVALRTFRATNEKRGEEWGKKRERNRTDVWPGKKIGAERVRETLLSSSNNNNKNQNRKMQPSVAGMQFTQLKISTKVSDLHKCVLFVPKK